MSQIKDFMTFMTNIFFDSFGLLAVPILLLVGSNVIDYITGLIVDQNKNTSSYKSIKVIFKKFSMYLLIIVGFMIDTLINFTVTNLELDINLPTFISCIIAIWLVCNEVISILKNLIDIGIELPNFLLPLIKKIKNKAEGKNETSNKT